jgi:hypothetical protein
MILEITISAHKICEIKSRRFGGRKTISSGCREKINGRRYFIYICLYLSYIYLFFFFVFVHSRRETQRHIK